jgi:hypothetical protein
MCGSIHDMNMFVIPEVSYFEDKIKKGRVFKGLARLHACPLLGRLPIIAFTDTDTGTGTCTSSCPLHINELSEVRATLSLGLLNGTHKRHPRRVGAQTGKIPVVMAPTVVKGKVGRPRVLRHCVRRVRVRRAIPI